MFLDKDEYIILMNLPKELKRPVQGVPGSVARCLLHYMRGGMSSGLRRSTTPRLPKRSIDGKEGRQEE